MRRAWSLCLLTIGVLVVALAAPGVAGNVAARPRTTAAVIGPADWPQYLHDPGHSSVDTGANSITPSNVATLGAAWSWTPPSVAGRPAPTLVASPTVAAGLIFVGTQSGWLYALDQATGQQVWAADTGYLVTTCKKDSARGLTATPTVAPDPVTGKLVVYEAGADATGSPGNTTLYAFDAATGQQLWATLVSNATGAYSWSSPIVVGGRVYVGTSSACDVPLVTGEIAGFNQSTGAPEGTYQADATGVLGGGVWTTPASDGTDLWATTGNGVHKDPVGDEESLVRINASTLAQDRWQVPVSLVDQDFAASPTLFSAQSNGSPTDFVGACDKNGVFYAFARDNLSAGPVWQTSVATLADAACDPAAVWDSGLGRLDLGTGSVTVGGTMQPGSIVQLDAGTGAVEWRTVMPGPVVGTATLNGAGVLAAGTVHVVHRPEYPRRRGAAECRDRPGPATVQHRGPVFGQPVFAGGDLLVASAASLTAYAPGATPPVTLEQICWRRHVWRLGARVAARCTRGRRTPQRDGAGQQFVRFHRNGGFLDWFHRAGFRSGVRRHRRRAAAGHRSVRRQPDSEGGRVLRPDRRAAHDKGGRPAHAEPEIRWFRRHGRRFRGWEQAVRRCGQRGRV